MSDAEAAKRVAAAAAVALVEDGMRLGLGTGSTMRHAVAALAQRIAAEGLHVTCIPTSIETEQQARALGIRLADFAAIDGLDLAIDGADEVERGTLRLIKGLGGALLREKIVAQAAARFVILADPSKIVDTLGTHTPLPIEVTRFGHEQTARRIAALGAAPTLRLRDGAPFVSDGGNLILDCAGLAPIRDPQTLQWRLRAIAGVVETGLFLDGVERAIIGAPDGSVQVLRAG
ncbi:MAG: ribose 5-phosphate isomerase A [Acetobacteraceae bacterium]